MRTALLTGSLPTMAVSCFALAAWAAEPYAPERIENALLPNAFRVTEKVISGGLPEGDAAFSALKELGVKTIISVDGAKPDAATAKKYGLRYVHLPHGYDGVPDERGRELAKAVRDLPGPIYLHCHHGKHRSPAASVVACVEVGQLAPENALTVLKTAGTSENYRGLYQSAQSARKIDDQTLNALKVEFVETAKIPPLAEAMIGVEHAFDHLKAFSQARWQKLPHQPALDPAHEALLLKEHYHELQRADTARGQPAEFLKMLAAAEKSAEALETALLLWLKAGAKGEPPAEIGTYFQAISQSCLECHRKFRDVPLSEKARR